MKFRKYLICTAVLLAVCLLAGGCGGNSAPTEAPTEPISTAGAPTESNALATFQEELESQDGINLMQFQRNFEKARELLAAGFAPEEQMPVYTPSGEAMDPASDLAAGGFYKVELDPEIFGVSSFYVIPAGERAMTAEEYLELAQASGMTANEMVSGENSWISLQADRGSANRRMSQKERFWANYLQYEVFRGTQETQTQPDAPVKFQVGGPEGKTFSVYPTADMSVYALEQAVREIYEYLLEDQMYMFTPWEDEMSWEEAVAAAEAAVEEKLGLTQTPEKNYVWYQGPSMQDLVGKMSSWTVALCYEDGSSYVVSMDGITENLITITKMPDGIFDYDRVWAADEPLPKGEIVYQG